MNVFDVIKVFKPKRSALDLSHEVKLSGNMGKLYPFFCQEVVPGDTFRMNSEVFLRFAPMLAPVMHRVNVYTHFFFVPNRLIWDNWETFITGGSDGLQTPVFPYMTASMSSSTGRLVPCHKGSLADYLGIPTLTANDSDASERMVSALPFRAYAKIYNEYYRDQNLTPEVGCATTDGVDAVTSRVILNRCWEKDYFTSALPWTQRGGDVNIPIDGAKIVDANGALATATPLADGTNRSVLLGSNQDILQGQLSTAANTTATINDLRTATWLQRWKERSAVGGGRYIEQIFAHFGVKSSDARLQRPEYLGGGKTPVQISEVLQTSATDQSVSAQGNMAGHGIAVGNTHSFKKYFEEHGFVIGIISILPRTSYQQGLPRIFKKFDKFDYYFPEFASLGEQGINNYEVFFNGTTGTNPNETFGYQQRYAEYRYIPSSVHGDFKDTLNYWHLGRVFSNQPSLNTDFVSANPSNRIFAVTDDSVDHIYIDIFNNLQAIRPMPKYPVPSL